MTKRKQYGVMECWSNGTKKMFSDELENPVLQHSSTPTQFMITKTPLLWSGI
ncbi:hypothetical protein D3OALGA1CA_2138 [Olavius algarvensis associated proteobacterium Delta 3]|nr:hypothetical protein D3OALGA1CA_2138 [Olavius algarvensis associated proteobacterium Delta 3]CAB5161271.1 hypothetical protein D3OALGB2SA_5437 [Olavius algarvensis associated proteobacterium Delta 3]